MYKAGQITSVKTKDGKKYLVRIKKVDGIKAICDECDFFTRICKRKEFILNRCALSDDDKMRCSYKIPHNCNLKILYKCQQTKKKE